MYIYLVNVFRYGLHIETLAFSSPRIAYRFIDKYLPVKYDKIQTGRGEGECLLYKDSNDTRGVELIRLHLHKDIDTLIE